MAWSHAWAIAGRARRAALAAALPGWAACGLFAVRMSQPDSPTQPQTHTQPAANLVAGRLIVLIGAAIAFSPVLRNGLLNWDDDRHLIDNPLLHLRTIGAFWTQPYFGLYIPVTYSVWTLTAALAGGVNPFALHLLNLLTHVLAAVMVLEILRRLTDPTSALFGALLFALHPLQVEAVAWASGFRDVLSAALALLAIWQYLAGRDGNRWQWSCWTLATVAFALGMLAKPTVLVTPAICLLLDRRRPSAKSVSLLIAWVGMAVAIGWIAHSAQPAQAAAPVSIGGRVVIAADSFDFYLLKLIWPASLGVDYGRTPAWVLDRPGWINAIELMIPIALIIFLYVWRRFDLLWRGMLVVLLALLPVLGLVSFDFQEYSSVADRYAYLSMLGFALAMAGLISLVSRRKQVIFVGWILLGCLAMRSFAQTFVWQDGTSLFEHALLVNDRSFLACSQLASISLDANNARDAEAWAGEAIRRNPDFAVAYATYGMALLRRTPPDFQLAEAAFRAALAHDSKALSAMTNLAALLAQEGRLGEAEQLCRRALAIAPMDVSAQINLGNLLVGEGRLEESQRAYAAALAVSPENEQAQTNWAAVLMKLGDRDGAQRHLTAALRTDPNYEPALRLQRQLAEVQ
jgi:tetratricopeptide (TPR) repeat protein